MKKIRDVAKIMTRVNVNDVDRPLRDSEKENQGEKDVECCKERA